ncbi:MAG TPA: dihydrofolate reductase family protein [Marmoricola sp.]|jgi:riboflavin biosynthesis pyrimidine reductase|nr:dihydrofolate reductase family protein [Marmoricola sp.]
MRVLLDDLTGASGAVADEDLPELYDAPESWLRLNFVATVDGAATGADGRSGSINNPVDKQVFHLLRRSSDAIIVGAGTARAEGYGPAVRPLVVLSRRGAVPSKLQSAPVGSVFVATTSTAPQIDEARELLGADQVLELGADEPDLTRLRPVLAERGLTRLLSEGGPHVFHDMLAAGIVDELDLTWVPSLVAGSGLRILAGAPLDVQLAPKVLLEQDGTMLGRWFVARG